ncbi:hypothetical protein [Rhizobium sp. SG570]|uniref:hypothetical protein n=1 Tax=Rhizobium sp. SG570 TaxID=2587113 RepID=UPI00064612CD|nr:hypothetical protein [Rhizobium sp. SG570]NKJ38795.1 hypothetical protein [Rhizobium sp. SG570]
MRVFLFIAAFMVASSVYAEDADRTAASKAAEEVGTQGIIYLGVAYICQDAIGASFYDLARERTVQAFSSLGPMDNPQAIRNSRDRAANIVDEQMKNFRREQKKLPARAAERCLQELQAAQRQLDLSISKFRIAARR